jgi:hypothetical protein
MPTGIFARKSPSEKTRQKIRLALMGHSVSKNTRKKISAKLRGRIYVENSKQKCWKRWYLKHKTEYHAKQKEWRSEHKEEVQKQQKLYRRQNQAKETERCRKWRLENPEKQKICTDNWRERNKKIIALYSKKYRKKHRAERTATQMKRHAQYLHAIPSWADLNAIKEFYKNCPKGYHVDHIIPLQHPLVAGLHVLSNLQYLPMKENLRKHNKFEPIYISNTYE